MATIAELFRQAGQLRQSGDISHVEPLYRRIIETDPANADAYFELGNTLFDQGRVEDAADIFRKGQRINRILADMHNNQGVALETQGHLDESRKCFLDALHVNPSHTAARSNLANIYYKQERWSEAAECYRQVLRINANQAATHFNLGLCLQKLGRIEEACASYGQALARNPNHADAHNNLGNALFAQGLYEDGIACFEKSLASNPTNVAAHNNIIFGLHFCPEKDALAICEECRRFDRLHAEPLKKTILPHANDRSLERRLRIGYVSGDFSGHPVGRFLLPLLANHDRSGFEIFCYSSVKEVDAVTARCRELSECWRNVRHASDEELAHVIRAEQIDILVDLAMHAADSRLLVFARKPAPVQVSYLAYCSTTGLSAMDYRLTDPYLDPPGLNDRCYSEKSIRLPETYWCYQPVLTLPKTPLPALQNGYVTFGCLNAFGKASTPTLKAWNLLLRTLPESRLLLYAPPISRSRLRDRLIEGGVAAERLEFVDKMPSGEYFETYQRMDVALDPFPYGGGTTTCDALWMGVPVVSLAGKTGVGRGGVSILCNVGLPDLLAHNIDEYVASAVKLAGNLPRLNALRTGMRERMICSPLMDAPRFARHVEAAYRAMWENWCASTKS